MSEFDTIEARESRIVIKDSPNWMVITDKVEISLYDGEESQIIGKSDGVCQWFLWVNNEFTAEIERAAKNHDKITATVEVK
jgi:hypothetical protein